MNRDELTRRLEQAGRGPVPPADAAFTDALEDRLRSVHATLPARDGASAAGLPRTAPVRAWWRSPVPVAAAMALLLAVSFGVALRPRDGVRLASAFDATVTLPDGRSVAAAPGQRLADGAVVLTGPQGHVEVDGVRLGPGEIAVVRDDRLEVVREARPDPAPARPTAPPPRDSGPLAALPAVPPVEGERPAARPSPHAGSERPSAPASPAPSRSPDQHAAPAPRPEPEDQRVVSDWSEPDAEHAIGLAVRAHEGRAVLMWTEFRHPDFAFFVILRAPHPAAPAWPPRDRSTLAGRSADPEQRQFAEQPPYRPVYRVVAVDRDGRELARSAAVTPGAARQ